MDESKKHRPWGRRVKWVGVGVLVFLISAVVAIQGLMWSSWPRRKVLAGLEERTGLRFEATSLSVGWMGDSKFDDVAISLPLEKEAIVRVKRVMISHTAIVPMMLGMKGDVSSIELESPAILLSQDAGGRWNVDKVAEVLSRVGGKGGQTQSTSAATRLPAIRIEDGRIEIVERNGRQMTIAPVQMKGKPEGQVAWDYELRAGDMGSVQGRIATGGGWEHEARVEIRDMKRLMSPWVKNWNGPTELAGRWKGRVAGGHLEGTADVEKLEVEGVRASGAVKVATIDGGVEVSGEGVKFLLARSAGPMVWTEGKVTFGHGEARGEGVTVEAGGGSVKLDARYGWEDGKANVSTVWQGVTLPGQWKLEGKLAASVERLAGGNHEVKATWQGVSSNGLGKSVNSQGQISATGAAWSQMEWGVNFDQLQVAGFKKAIDLKGSKVALATHGSHLELKSISVANMGGISGHGELEVGTGKWSLNVEAPSLPGAIGGQQSSALAEASGTFERVDVKRLEWRTGGAKILASGFYDRRLPKPLDVQVVMDKAPLRAQAHMAGTIAPVELHGDANVDVGAVRLVAMQMTGRLAGRKVEVGISDGNSFGGKGDGKASIDLDDVYNSEAALGLRDLDMAELVAAFPNLKGSAGKISSNLKLESSRDEARPLGPLRLVLSWKSDDTNYRGLKIGNLEAKAYLSNKRFVVSQAKLGLGDGNVSAWARGSGHDGEAFSTLLQVDFDHVNLDQLVHCVAPEAHRMPGLLDGKITAMGNPFQRDRISGNGTVHITDSDLADWDVLSAVFAAIKIGGKEEKPEGRGHLRFSVEKNQLQVTQLVYRNRGMDVLAAGTAENVWKMPDTPLSGWVAGSVTPLKEIKLPILSDAQSILKTLQLSVTTFKLGGTVRKPQTTPVPFSEVGETIKGILTGTSGK